MNDEIRIPILSVHQGRYDFYVGVMKARDLYSIAESDRMRLEVLEVPKYAGIQRPLDEARVRQIREYITEPDCNFPNAIVVSLDSQFIRTWNGGARNNNVSEMVVERNKGAFEIIDGQHRAFAFDEAKDDFEVIVSIFLDLAKWESAAIFAKINSTQRKVNASIAFQLFGYAEYRSPQRTAHELAERLNTTKNSPFFRGLRMMGTKDTWSKDGYLSQSTFCKGIMRLYSQNPEKDQNRLARGLPLEPNPSCPLRRWFMKEQDDKILEVIWRFFRAVAREWKDQWVDRTSILNKTTGFNSFIDLLKGWLLDWRERQGTDLDEASVNKALEELSAKLEAIRDNYTSDTTKFIRTNYPAGNQGVVMLRQSLYRDLGIQG